MSDVFPSLSVKECADRLMALESPVLVLMHVRPDGDTVGSGTALTELLTLLGKRAEYFCPDPIPDRLDFLTEGLTRAEAPEGYQAVSIDVASPSQLGSAFGRADVKLTIDHHARNTPYAPNLTVSEASSAGEVLFSVVRELCERGALTMTVSLAKRLYASISSDTGGFAYSNCSPNTHRAAAELMEYGFDSAEVNRLLFNTKTAGQLRAEAQVASSVKTAAGGRITYATLTRAARDAEGLDVSCFETAIDVVRSLMGCEIAFTVKELEDGIKISLRSTGKDVSTIAVKYGGGGHVRAAACTLVDVSAEEATAIILRECEKLYE